MMIRPATAHDTNRIIEIWLNASRLAHNFIPFEFWLKHADDMRNVYLPNSETFVSDTGRDISGFLSFVSNNLAALFVDPLHQKLGFGKQLIQFAQSHKSQLDLCVYKRNAGAIAFYRAAGFGISEEKFNLDTSEIEYVMNWSRVG